jgi:hypothetical protein
VTESWYVYAVLGRGARLPACLTGLGDAALSSVPCRELAVAVSPIEATGLRPTAENVLRHEAIVEALRLSAPALPVRFGTVLPSLDVVASAIDERYEVLMADLVRLGDTIEFGLTVLWEPSAFSHAERGEGATRAQGLGTRYLQSRVAAYRHEVRQREEAEAIARTLETTLGCYTLEQHRILLPTQRLAVRAAYLVRPSNVELFRAAFEAVRHRQPNLRLLLSGPWPPYSFVSPVPISDQVATANGA